MSDAVIGGNVGEVKHYLYSGAAGLSGRVADKFVEHGFISYAFLRLVVVDALGLVDVR